MKQSEIKSRLIGICKKLDPKLTMEKESIDSILSYLELGMSDNMLINKILTCNVTSDIRSKSWLVAA